MTHLAPFLYDTPSPGPSSAAPLGFLCFTSSRSPLVPSGLLPLRRSTGYPHTHAPPSLSIYIRDSPKTVANMTPRLLHPGAPLCPHPRNLPSLLSFKTLPDASSHSVSSPREALYDTLSPSIPPSRKFPPGPLYPFPLRPQWLPIPGALCNPRTPQFHASPTPLRCPPAALSQFRMSEMNTASPRIPSPLDTAGMMAVVSAPGLAGQGAAQRGLASGGREERTPSNAEEPSRPRGEGGLAGEQAG